MAKKYRTEICTCCGQTKNYIIPLDHGSARIVIAMFNDILAKGKNEIHPAREMDLSGERKWYLTNISRPRFHGLIAKVKGKRGYYCITRKGALFMRGMNVPKYAIISKVTGHQEGYYMPDDEKTNIQDLLLDPTMWEDSLRVRDMLDSMSDQQNSNLFV